MTPTTELTHDSAGHARPVRTRAPHAFSHATNGGSSTQQLWAAMFEARGGSTPRTLAHVEDAVFRFYLPLAHSMAQHPSIGSIEPTAAVRAAELGLAQAILAWRRAESAAFPAFARTRIEMQLQRLVNVPVQ